MQIKVYTLSLLLAGTALSALPAHAQTASGAENGTSSVMQTSAAPQSSSVTAYPVNEQSAFAAGNVTVYPVSGAAPRVYGAPSVSDYTAGVSVVQGSMQAGSTVPAVGGLTSMGAPIIADISAAQLPAQPESVNSVMAAALAPATDVIAQPAPGVGMQPILSPEEAATAEAVPSVASAPAEPEPVMAEPAVAPVPEAAPVVAPMAEGEVVPPPVVEEPAVADVSTVPPQKPEEVIQAEEPAMVEPVAPLIETAQMAPAPVDNTELDNSLIHKIALLEAEKESLRKKLMQANPGDAAPVYNCAAETNRIKELEAENGYLTEENSNLKKRGAELEAQPKVESLMESDVSASDAQPSENDK